MVRVIVWCVQEDQLLLEYHRQMGNKWTEIARMIGGRTDNAVKNRYHALTRRDGKLAVDHCEDNSSSCLAGGEKHVRLTSCSGVFNWTEALLIWC